MGKFFLCVNVLKAIYLHRFKELISLGILLFGFLLSFLIEAVLGFFVVMSYSTFIFQTDSKLKSNKIFLINSL